MSFMKIAAATVSAATLIFAPPAMSQCFNDDGFAVPGACCVNVMPTLPPFPGFSIPSLGACFDNCIPVSQWNVKIQITPPAQIFCDVFVIQADITGPTVLNPSTMIARYARTWEEVDASGTNLRQVWRFLVNCDFTYQITPLSTSPCPIPAVAMAGLPVHFIGSIDYARDCSSGIFSVAINLTNLCGDFMHNSISVNPISPNPNPTHMYSFVGPIPFLYAPAPVPAGGVRADAVRSVTYNLTASPLQWDCKSEVPVQLNGNLATVGTYCACAQPPNPTINAWVLQQLVFPYGCPGTTNLYNNIAWAPLLPTGLSAFSLGRYTGPIAVFPGNESISLYIGVSQAPDPCGTNFPVHIVTGVGTVTSSVGIVHSLAASAPVITNQFLDLEDMMVLIAGPPYIGIGIGGLFLSPMLWSLNF